MIASLAQLRASRESNLSAFRRVMVYKGELYRVPAKSQKVRVASGLAYVTQAARDALLGPGHELLLDHNADSALVSVLQSHPLIIEVYGGED